MAGDADGRRDLAETVHRCHDDALLLRLDRLGIQAQQSRKRLDVPAVRALDNRPVRLARGPATRALPVLAGGRRCAGGFLRPRWLDRSAQVRGRVPVQDAADLGPVRAPRLQVSAAGLDEGPDYPQGRQPLPGGRALESARGVVRFPREAPWYLSPELLRRSRSQKANSRTGEPSRSSGFCGRPMIKSLRGGERCGGERCGGEPCGGEPCGLPESFPQNARFNPLNCPFAPLAILDLLDFTGNGPSGLSRSPEPRRKRTAGQAGGTLAAPRVNGAGVSGG